MKTLNISSLKKKNNNFEVGFQDRCSMGGKLGKRRGGRTGLARGGRWCWTMGASVWKPPREKCWQWGGDVWHKGVPAIPALLGHLWVPSAATSQAGGFPVDPQLWRHLKILYQCTEPAMGHPRAPHRERRLQAQPRPSSDAPSTSSNSHKLPQHLLAAHPWPRTPMGHTQGHPGLPQSGWCTYIYTDIKEIALVRGDKGKVSLPTKVARGNRSILETSPCHPLPMILFLFFKKGCGVQHQR